MSKPRILLQLDGDAQPSSFDAVVAADCEIDHLLQYSNVTVPQVRGLVHGAIFTRGPDDLHRTAIFIGGTDVANGERLLREVESAFFGPLRVSVMLDANGANTTAAAAVLAARRHLELDDAEVLVLAATGSVGQRVARLLAQGGAAVRVGSRTVERAESVCQRIGQVAPDARLTACRCDSESAIEAAIDGVSAVISAGAAGVRLVSTSRLVAAGARVAIDLNAVPPLGIEGVAVSDRATDHDGLLCHGAVGVGGTKMKIHELALRRLFETNDAVLDAEEIYRLGSEAST